MTRARTYNFGKSRLTVRFGDIVGADAQIIVSSDDCYITMGGGVSAAILRAGGEAIPLDAAKKVPAALGDVVVTTAGALSAQYIFHAITIGPNPEHVTPSAVVERTTRRCMRLLDELHLTSIAFPAIGAGAARFATDEVAAQMSEVIADELSRNLSGVEVSIFLLDRFETMTEMDFIRFFEEFAARAPRVAKKTAPDSSPAAPSVSSTIALAAETHEEYNRRRIHSLRQLLAKLEDQRGTLEQHLIGLLGTEHARVEEERTRKSLAENQELRLQYLNELHSYLGQSLDTPRPGTQSRGPWTVFVSSTSLDLKPHREGVKDAIARCDLFFRGMEHMGASGEGLPAANIIVEAVRKSDVYIGIFGVRYGSVEPATGLSMTELEFREAETGKKPMLLYVMHEEAVVPVAHLEKDAEAHRKLSSLKTYILNRYVPYMFRDAGGLAHQAHLDLEKLKAQLA